MRSFAVLCLCGAAVGQNQEIALANGVPQTGELLSSAFAFYTINVPNVRDLPLNLALTTLAGEAGVFVSTHARPDSSNAEWALPRGGANHLTISAIPKLVRADAECTSDDVWVGTVEDAAACAAACAARADCQFFIFGKGTKAGDCYVENTADATCAEGFEEDEFDFFELGGGAVHVSVLGHTTTSFAITASWAHAPVHLDDGFPQAWAVKEKGLEPYIARVSGSTSDLSLVLTVQSGDADLYVKAGAPPTKDDYTWRSNAVGDDRLTISHSDAAFCVDCDYYIGVAGVEDSAYMLTASSSDVLTVLGNGVPSNKVVNLGKSLHFKMTLPEASSNVQIVLTRLSGNPDMYVSLTEHRPTKATASWSSADAAGDVILIPYDDVSLQTCVGAADCTLFITVYGVQDNSAFSLLAHARKVSNGFHVDSPASLAGDFEFTASTFGAPLPRTPLTAAVVYARPGTACPPEGAAADWSLSNAAELAGAIALVDRGSNCPYPGRYFANKVMQAQRAGAVAVIVADDRDDPMVYMGAASGDQASQVTIPSIFTTRGTGASFKQQLTNGLRVTLSQPQGRNPLLISGQPLAGVAEANQIQYYELMTGTAPATITLTLAARFGNPDLFISACVGHDNCQKPNQATYTWKSESEGSDTLVIAADDPKQQLSSKYIVGVLGGGGVSASYSLTLASASDMVSLQANVPLPQQRVDVREYKYYKAWVDSGADAVTVAITVASGDADLYVSFDNPRPDAADAPWSAKGRSSCQTVDCGNTIRNGDAIHIRRDHPNFCKAGSASCVIYVAVYGAETTVFSTLVTMSDRGTEAAPQLLDGEPMLDAVPHAGEYSYFNFFVPEAATSVAFAVKALAGDPDLYVGFGQRFPSKDEFAYRSTEEAGETLVISTSDSQACTGCMYRLAVYSWSGDVQFSITATATSAATLQDQNAPAQQTSTATAGLVSDFPTPVHVDASAEGFYRYTFAHSSTATTPVRIAFTPDAGAPSNVQLKGRFGERPVMDGLQPGDTQFSFALSSGSSSHDLTADELEQDCPPSPALCQIYVGLVGPARGSLLVSTSQGSSKHDGKGGGLSGGGVFFLILLLLLLLGAAVYCVRVRQGKRDAAADWAALREGAAAATDKVRGMRSRGGRSRISGTESMVAPLTHTPYQPPLKSDLAPLAPDGTAGSRGVGIAGGHVVDMEE